MPQKRQKDGNPFRNNEKKFAFSLERFWMDNLYCEGHEKSLTDCRFDGWGMSDCTEAEAAGVICESPESIFQEPEIIQPSKIKIKVWF